MFNLGNIKRISHAEPVRMPQGLKAASMLAALLLLQCITFIHLAHILETLPGAFALPIYRNRRDSCFWRSPEGPPEVDLVLEGRNYGTETYLHEMLLLSTHRCGDSNMQHAA